MVISYDYDSLKKMKRTLDISEDFICEYYFSKYSYPGHMTYLQPNLFERLLKSAKTESEKEQITRKFGYLVSPNI